MQFQSLARAGCTSNQPGFAAKVRRTFFTANLYALALGGNVYFAEVRWVIRKLSKFSVSHSPSSPGCRKLKTKDTYKFYKVLTLYW